MKLNWTNPVYGDLGRRQKYKEKKKTEASLVARNEAGLVVKAKQISCFLQIM
jgi:hypothetical protein